jgi:hypothetical protein
MTTLYVVPSLFSENFNMNEQIVSDLPEMVGFFGFQAKIAGSKSVNVVLGGSLVRKVLACLWTKPIKHCIAYFPLSEHSALNCRGSKGLADALF